jgi:hypothetical protein
MLEMLVTWVISISVWLQISFSICTGFGYGYQILKVDIYYDGGINEHYFEFWQKNCYLIGPSPFARFCGWTILLYLHLFTPQIAVCS